jgi:hypothetical protein
MHKDVVSYEWARQKLACVDKFELKQSLLGTLAATQQVRELRRLHTYYPGQRTELDYTKYGVYLYPTTEWNVPLLFSVGIAIDHYSTVIKAVTTTVDPSSRDAIRLYRRAVLPKSMWMPAGCENLALEWDVFGLEDLVAIDNAMDLVSDAVIQMFCTFGVIVLRMPPRRGDLKGTVERTQKSLEDSYISGLPGYIPQYRKPLSPEYRHIRTNAERAAKLTVAEFEQRLFEMCCDYNRQPHPRLKRPRITTWRAGQERAPVLLPTGLNQLRATFALTFEVQLRRDGVCTLGFYYNSAELFAVFRTYTGTVTVKLDPDDIRTVLVFVPGYVEPIEATLTTFELDFKCSLELARLVLKRLASEHGSIPDASTLTHQFPREVESMRTGARSATGSIRTDAQAAAHAADAVVPLPETVPAAAADVSALLRDSRLETDNG